ncbi:MAG: PAS domain-containing sensor histidine kinase [Ktedonobacterales bacterium]|nr:PAS domain-containing sensor histidine kinase [Ktedonobacterales bacterium]
MDQHAEATPAQTAARLFAHGGITGALLAAIAWETTPLGPAADWPPSLRTSVRLCLTSHHPGVLWWVPDHLLIYNDAAIPLLGTRHPAALGQPGPVGWPEIWAIMQPLLAQVQTTGTTATTDDHLPVGDDRADVTLTFVCSPIEDDVGQVAGIFSELIERNGTERRAARARTRQLETTIAAMSEGVALYDARGRLIQLNAAAQTLIGLHDPATTAAFMALPDVERARQLALHDAQGELLLLADLPQHRILRGETLAASDALELTGTTLTGQGAVWSCAGAPLRDEAGHITGGVLTFRDVTAQRQFEHHTHEVLAAVLAMAAALTTVPEPAASSAANAVLTQVVRLAHEVLRGVATSVVTTARAQQWLTPLAVVGLLPADEARWWTQVSATRLADAAPPPADARLLAGEETLLVAAPGWPPGADNGPPTALVVPVPLAQDTLLLTVTRAAGVPFTAPEHELARTAARLAANVVERERLLAAYLATQAREAALVEAQRRMDEFLGIASHELRTPLTSVTANVQLSARGLARLRTAGDSVPRSALARYEQLAARTVQQLARLARLVDDLLDVSRITAGQLALRPAPLDLGGVVQEAAELVRAAWPERVITVTQPRQGDLTLVLDGERISQVVVKLLTNALKYSAPDTPVRITVRRGVGTLRVQVQDRGPGIPRGQQLRLFERFYRVPGIEQQSGSEVGLGLGLYICRTIIERHGGTLGVSSTPGVGSTFFFALPTTPSRPQHS